MSTTIEPQVLPGPTSAPDFAPPAPAAHASAPATADRAPVAPNSAPPTRSAAPVDLRKAPAKETDRAGRAMIAVTVVSILCGVIIGAIGFAASYSALYDVAVEAGFGKVARVVPIGIDAGVVAMYGLDLVLAWRRNPRPLLRYTGHLLTVATIVLNATSGEKTIAQDPAGAAMHAVMPVLFVAIVEAARHLVIRTARVRLGGTSTGVPLYRWLLSPWKSFRLFRRMKLWEIPSYTQALALEKERTVYAAWLEHKHGKGWKKKAGAEAMLPFLLAPYGLSVEEALALPEEQREAERAREAAKRELAAAAEAAEEMRKVEAERRQAEAAVARMRITATVTTAEHTIAAETTTAAAEARAAEAEATVRAAAKEKVAAARAETEATTAVLAAEAARRQAEHEAQAAERAAQVLAEAEESAEAAEARAREAAALRAEAEDQKAAAATIEEANRLERDAAKHSRKAAEDRAAAERLLTEQAEMEAARAAAERQAAEDRAAAERAELAALEAEDLARLSIRDRAERRVARLILAAGGTPQDTVDALRERVTLEEVSELLHVGRTVAGERRQAAADLIAAGYTG